MERNVAKRPLITIGMLTKDRAWCLPKVLKSIKDIEYPKERLKLVFVDGCSTDGTWDIIKTWANRNEEIFHGIVPLRKKTNIPEARNLCLTHAEGSYILFWDSDVIPGSPDLISQILGIMERDLDIGAIGCSYIYENPSFLLRIQKAPVSRYTNGVFLGFALIRLEILRDIGDFNENMSVGEDTEIFIRMREKTHCKIMWGPTPCLHLRSPGTAVSGPTKFSEWLRYTYGHRAEAYFKEFGNLPVFLRVRVLYYLLLPVLWIGVLLLLSLGTFGIWLTIALILSSLIPPLALACNNSGFRSGLITGITFFLPTGIALSYGVLREAIRSLFRMS